jgi:hypothetical protein
MNLQRSFFTFLILIISLSAFSQSSKEGIFVDKEGVIRWNKDKKEAYFFGVNYSAPFVFGYRHIKASGISVEQAIKDDVYHLSRLGLNAFRIHVFDTEITDSVGNILENEHLRLFDFLIAELKKRNIKILLTPIAYWGNGYPERDVPTGSFAFKYGKREALANREAWKAQENYLNQFFSRKNRYTGLTYQEDADVLATEINNEPHHSGEKSAVTEYINTMVKTVRNTGWKKPVFYNISESPTYSDAVVKADVQGHSFQWYPTGLVANRTQKGNLLPHVHQYTIPFDSIPAFKKRAKVVYEFDAADVFDSYMYPAMARSFRKAGFQWATMFAYEPMAIANVNTEYQTHYLNLAYTPSKAISYLIAGKLFRNFSSNTKIQSDSLFADIKLSYAQNLSELNNTEEFYYSNSTQTQPLNSNKLTKIAGVGSSPVINYKGTGAYFLDKIKDGVWRLELMPDAIHVRDPFEKASPKKEVTSIVWKAHEMSIYLSNIGDNFKIQGINKANNYSAEAVKSMVTVSPGTYIITAKGVVYNLKAEDKIGAIKINEFVAPETTVQNVFVKHVEPKEISESQPTKIKATIVGIDDKDEVTVFFNHLSNRWLQRKMEKVNAYDFELQIPQELLVQGLLQYRIVVSNKTQYYTFPGNVLGQPNDWDFYAKDAYKVFVVKNTDQLELFNANKNREEINYYNPDWNNYKTSFVASETPHQLAVKSLMEKANGKNFMGWQHFVAEKINARRTDLNSFSKLVLSAKANVASPLKAKIALITKDAKSYAAYIQLNPSEELITVNLNQLRVEDMLLLPRPYPGFLPLFYKSQSTKEFNLNDVEKIEVTFGYDLPDTYIGKEVAMQVSTITLK